LRKSGIDASEAEINQILDSQEVMKSYESQGGTGPEAVAAMLAQFKKDLKAKSEEFQADRRRVSSAYDACRSVAKHAGEAKTPAALAELISKSFARAL
jgi:hypothetical protein